MTAPHIKLNTVLYAGNAVGPANISANTNDVYASGFSTILLGLFHIGRGPGAKHAKRGQQTGDIVFNNPDDPDDRGVIVIRDGELFDPATTWPQQLKQLFSTTSGKGNVSAMGCSVGGGGVEDYQTIWGNFIVNGSISDDTALYRNFKALKDNFDFIDFIDFDCEEFSSSYYPKYSWTQTLTAFGKMLKEIGFSITFCPYVKKQMPDWMGVLKSLYAPQAPTVRWMNLQCYDGGADNDPADWANAINKTKLGIDGASFIVPGLWCCNTDKPECGSVPTAVESKFALWKTRKEKPIELQGGFIWKYEDILANQNSTDCDRASSAAYCSALLHGLGP